jgi:hypothetical protein
MRIASSSMFRTMIRGENAVIFLLNGRKNPVIGGNGSRLIFHGRVTPFTIIGSSDITLRDLTIDWQVPFHCEGDIDRVDPAGKWVELTILEQFSYRTPPSENSSSRVRGSSRRVSRTCRVRRPAQGKRLSRP